MKIDTRCAQGVEPEAVTTEPMNPPVVMSATYGFADLEQVERYYESHEGYLYNRYASPTVRAAERFLAALEGAPDAALFGSGMAAISTTFLTLARAGDRVAVQENVYGGTTALASRLLPQLGIEVRWLSLGQLREPDASLFEGCRLVYMETPVNPTLETVDLEAVTRVTGALGIPTAVDSTFGTPVQQRPHELGCSLVLHSCTKYLGGHADLTGGAVAGEERHVRAIVEQRKTLGGMMDPWTAFLLYRGMRTLAVRVRAQADGAAAVAAALKDDPRVERVLWPGFGGMVSFEPRGGFEAARRVHDRVRLFRRAGSLGGVESLLSIPVTMSHRGVSAEQRERAGVTDGLIRLSIGLEDPGDLIADLDQALGD